MHLFFCKQCRYCLCYVCLEKSHDEHTFCKLKSAEEDIRNEIETFFDDTCTGSSGSETKDSLVDMLNEYEIRRESEKSEIRQETEITADKMISDIQESKTKLLMKLDELFSEILKPKCDLESRLEECKGIVLQETLILYHANLYVRRLTKSTSDGIDKQIGVANDFVKLKDRNSLVAESQNYSDVIQNKILPDCRKVKFAELRKVSLLSLYHLEKSVIVNVTTHVQGHYSQIVFNMDGMKTSSIGMPSLENETFRLDKQACVVLEYDEENYSILLQNE